MVIGYLMALVHAVKVIKQYLTPCLVVVSLVQATTWTFYNRSMCLLPSGSVLNNPGVDCSTGEIILASNYINLGIHNAGSFGTSNIFTTDYYTGNLGILADVYKHGFQFNSTIDFAGDYTTPSLPVEGALF